MHPATKVEADVSKDLSFGMTRKIKTTLHLHFFKYQEGVLDLTGSIITHFKK